MCRTNRAGSWLIVSTAGIAKPALAIAFILALSTTMAAAARQFTADLVRPNDVAVNNFSGVLAGVQRSPQSVQARFAEIAIDTLIQAYTAELENDRAVDFRRLPRDPSWVAGTRRYIESLERIVRAIRPDDSLRIIRVAHGAARLVIGHEQVMLSAPRLDEQEKLERDIADNACTFIDCDQRYTTMEDRVASRTSKISREWVFGTNNPPAYSSYDGLRCVFDDRRHLELKRRTCDNLLYEIRLLLETTLALKAHGKLLDWRHLAIAHVANGTPQKLIYNGHGNFVSIHLPNLLRAQAVWRGAVPWLVANLAGRQSQHVINLSDQSVFLTSSQEN